MTPTDAAAYWRLNVETHPYFNPECECAVTLLLDIRRGIKGHCLISVGTIDTLLVGPREVFRAAIAASAAGIILMHNHPSGDSTPSPADIDATRYLIRSGDLLKLELLDHVIMGARTPKNPKGFCSLREQGWFYKDAPSNCRAAGRKRSKRAVPKARNSRIGRRG